MTPSNPASSLDESRLRRLLDAGRTVFAEREPEAVLDRLLQVARELTGARYAAIGVLDDARTGLADFITAGMSEVQRETIGALPRGHGVLGLLINHPAPLRLSDVGQHPQSYGFPPGHPAMGSFLGVPIMIRGEAWGNLYLTDKDGGAPFDDADEQAAVVLAEWASIAVENARLYRQTDVRAAELERSVEALRATSDIARALGGETHLERVLELIAKRSRALVDASGVAILLSQGDHFEIKAVAGNLPREIVGSTITRQGSVAGRVVARGESERVPHVDHSLRFALRDLGVEARAGLFVPLTYRGDSLGVIEVFDRVGGPEFGADHERLLEAAAASAAVAVATAQFVEQDSLRRTMRAAEEERRRWARELHDDTLQALGGLRVLLASARRADDAGALRRAIDTALAQLSQEIASLRGLITELRPAALDEIGLEPALVALVQRVGDANSLPIAHRFELAYERGTEPNRLDPDLETIVYRVVQESLTNIVRHAEATSVMVEVLEDAEELRITVTDDGRGFDSDQRTRGFGLTGMRERVALAGGSLQVSSSPSGTAIRARLPVARTLRRTA